MRFTTPALAALAVMLATPAYADAPKEEGHDAAKKDDGAAKADTNIKPEKAGNGKAEEAEKICRRVRLTGSRRLKRVCMTKEQWRSQNNGN